MQGYFGSNYFGSNYFASYYFRGASTPVVRSAPPGPGKARHLWTECSPKKKRRKQLQQALIVTDFDFIAAQESLN